MVAIIASEREVAVVAGRRTPMAKAGTALRHVHAAALAKVAIQETLWRAPWSPQRLDEVILGNVVMPADAANLARVSALYAGVPARIPGLTIQRNCASGMEAIAEAMLRIRAGHARAIVAGGVESMSTVPLLFPAEATESMTRLARARSIGGKIAAVARFRPRHFKPVSGLELGLTDPTCGMIMSKTAEVLAHEFAISRAAQDEFALKSHHKAVAAAQSGRFAEEMSTFYAGDRFEPVTADNGPRANQSMEALAKLKPLTDKRDGTVTAGNSCQITDGAAALLLADAEMARAEGVPILGYVRAYSYVGLDPARMGLGPVFAIESLLRQTGVKLSDIDLFEINEAFAAQVLACLIAMESTGFCREHFDRDSPIGTIDPARLNVNGGAIALGHPVGATGARIVLSLLIEMKRRNARLGVASLCVGGGQGAAILLEQK
jgi:acetyl-CoA acetyltransferase family protein